MEQVVAAGLVCVLGLAGALPLLTSTAHPGCADRARHPGATPAG